MILSCLLWFVISSHFKYKNALATAYFSVHGTIFVISIILEQNSKILGMISLVESLAEKLY